MRRPSARLQIDDAAATAHDPAEFARRTLDAIGQIAPCDDRRFFTVDPESRLLNRLLAATANDAPFRLRWLSEIYLSEMSAVPYFAPQVLMDEGIGVMLYRPRQAECVGLSAGLLERVDPATHWRVFHDSLTPIGGSMRVLIGDARGWLGMIDAVRREPGRPFTAAEVALVRALRAPIARGLRRSLAYERAIRETNAVDGDATSGVLLLDRRGRISYASPAGEQWARRLRDGDGGEAGDLPTAVLAAAAAHREDPAGAAVQVLARTKVGQVRIEAASGGPGGSITVIIAPEIPRRAPSLPDDWPLSPAERRIVGHLIRGARNNEIAAALHISEATVETHLAHIYDKLGARGRGDVLARLFAEQFLPVLTSDGRSSSIATRGADNTSVAPNLPSSHRREPPVRP